MTVINRVYAEAEADKMMVPLVTDPPTQHKVSGREALEKAEGKVTLKCHPTSEGVQGVESGSFPYTLNLQPFVNRGPFILPVFSAPPVGNEGAGGNRLRAKRHNFKNHRGNVPSIQ